MIPAKQTPHINKLAKALDSRYAGSGFKVDVYIKSVHEQLQLREI